MVSRRKSLWMYGTMISKLTKLQAHPITSCKQRFCGHHEDSTKSSLNGAATTTHQKRLTIRVRAYGQSITTNRFSESLILFRRLLHECACIYLWACACFAVCGECDGVSG